MDFMKDLFRNPESLVREWKDVLYTILTLLVLQLGVNALSASVDMANNRAEAEAMNIELTEQPSVLKSALARTLGPVHDLAALVNVVLRTAVALLFAFHAVKL